MTVELVGDLSTYDTLFPTALVRVTFQKAHFWHTAAQFQDASLDVYNRLGPIAHLSPAQPFPLAGDATTWTVDARNYMERPVAEVIRQLAEACDVSGTDYVEVAKVQVLNAESVRKSTGVTGSAERAMASAGATTTAARNPGDAVGDTAQKIEDRAKAVFGELKTLLIIVAVIAVLALLLMRKS